MKKDAKEFSKIPYKKNPGVKAGCEHRQRADKEGNNDYYALFEQATDAIMVTDFEGNFKDVNSSLCFMFGYTKAELLYLNVRALLDAENIKKNPLRFDLLKAGENVFNERKMIDKNGRIIYVEANAKKFADNRVLVIARNITERKREEKELQTSEANLNTIFDNTDTIYVLLDKELRIIKYNKRAYNFAELELGHSIEMSEYFLDYFPMEKRKSLKRSMKDALKGKNINYEVSYPQPNGSLNWYYVRMYPVSKGDKNIYGIMVAVSDITDKMVLEEKLERERILKQQEITNAVITAEENERHAIALELHDNVNQLLATSRLFLSSAMRKDAKEFRATLAEADKYIDLAINELRNLSHSMISPFIEDEGLLKALDHLINTISKTSEITFKKELCNIEENEIPEKLKLVVYRIIQEQLNNILKYAKAKTICLKLNLVRGKLTLHIKDDGIGFNPKKKTEGIGLLNIKTRASLFNGKVNVISARGKGCELIVNFN